MEAKDLCNSALSLIGQGTLITDMDEDSKEAASCRSLYPQVLRRCAERHHWSWLRCNVNISSDDLVSSDGSPFLYKYKLPDDCMEVLFIQANQQAQGGTKVYNNDLRFDYRTDGNAKYLIASVQAPFTLHYEKFTEDLSVYPQSFIEIVEYALAARLAADLVKGTGGVSISQTMASRSDELDKALAATDLPVELPVDELTKDVLMLVGQAPGEKLEEKRAAVEWIAFHAADEIRRIEALHPWSFCRKQAEITEKQGSSKPLLNSYKLPDDFGKALYIIPQDLEEEQGKLLYTYDSLFDFMTEDQKLMITSAEAPFTLVYQAEVLDQSLIPAPIREALAYSIASDYLARFFKQVQTQRQTTALAVSEVRSNGVTTNDAQALAQKSSDILDKYWAEDLWPVLPFDHKTQRVADLLGFSLDDQDIDQQRRFAAAVCRIWPECFQQCLDAGNWSFARKDEFIDARYLMENVISLPWRFTYTLPDDCAHVLRLDQPRATWRAETIGYPERLRIPFGLRNYEGKVVLCTDRAPGFSMHYQAKVEDLKLCDPLLVQGIDYLVASRLCPSVKADEGTAQKRNNTEHFYQMGMLYVNKAQQRDAEQGGYSLQQRVLPKFARARR